MTASMNQKRHRTCFRLFSFFCVFFLHVYFDIRDIFTQPHFFPSIKRIRDQNEVPVEQLLVFIGRVAGPSVNTEMAFSFGFDFLTLFWICTRDAGGVFPAPPRLSLVGRLGRTARGSCSWRRARPDVLYVFFSLQFLPARYYGNCELRRVED